MIFLPTVSFIKHDILYHLNINISNLNISNINIYDNFIHHIFIKK